LKRELWKVERFQLREAILTDEKLEKIQISRQAVGQHLEAAYEELRQFLTVFSTIVTCLFAHNGEEDILFRKECFGVWGACKDPKTTQITLKPTQKILLRNLSKNHYSQSPSLYTSQLYFRCPAIP
jgi:hypothetical protein